MDSFPVPEKKAFHFKYEAIGYAVFFLDPLADIKAQKNLIHKRQIIDTTLLKCYLQVGAVAKCDSA